MTLKDKSRYFFFVRHLFQRVQRYCFFFKDLLPLTCIVSSCDRLQNWFLVTLVSIKCLRNCYEDNSHFCWALATDNLTLCGIGWLNIMRFHLEIKKKYKNILVCVQNKMLRNEFPVESKIKLASNSHKTV